MSKSKAVSSKYLSSVLDIMENRYKKTVLNDITQIINQINDLEKVGINTSVVDDMLVKTIVNTDDSYLPIDIIQKELSSDKKYKEIMKKVNKKMLIKKLHDQT